MVISGDRLPRPLPQPVESVSQTQRASAVPPCVAGNPPQIYSSPSSHFRPRSACCAPGIPPRVSRGAFGSLSPDVRKRIKDYASFGLAERKARTGLQGQANLKAPHENKQMPLQGGTVRESVCQNSTTHVHCPDGVWVLIDRYRSPLPKRPWPYCIQHPYSPLGS